MQVGQRPTGGWMGLCCRTAPRVPSVCVMGPSTPSRCQAWGLPTRVPSPTAQGPWSPRPSCWSKVPADETPLHWCFCHCCSCTLSVVPGSGGWGLALLHTCCVGIWAGCSLASWTRKVARLRAQSWRLTPCPPVCGALTVAATWPDAPLESRLPSWPGLPCLSPLKAVSPAVGWVRVL